MSDIILGTPGLDTPGQPSSLAGLGYDQSDVGDWVTLLKPRVISLVVLTGVVGLMVAPGRLPAALAIAAVLCIALGAGAAGAINMWYDRDIDARMKRTATRPIPAGRIPAGAALGYGITLSVASVVIMGLATNWVAAAVLAVSIGFYVFVYTMWLKRRTPQNIVIGGAAGAFPPVIGWAAVTGDIAWPPVVLFAIIFLWTPPHFWALSLFAHADYERVGVPMLPVTHGARETRRQVLLYTLVLVPFTFVPCLMQFGGWIYGAAAALLGGIFLWHAWLVWTDRQDAAGRSLDGDKRARKAFRYSLSYLGLLFIALAVDHMMLAN